MIVRWLRRIFWRSPDDHWRGGDSLFVVLGIYLGVRVGRSYDSLLAGLGVALLVTAVRDLLFYLVVKPRRDRSRSKDRGGGS